MSGVALKINTGMTRGGLDFMARHFGAKSETMSEVVQGVVREAIQTLVEY